MGKTPRDFLLKIVEKLNFFNDCFINFDLKRREFDKKNNGTEVTELDRSIEKKFAEFIRENFPQHVVLGEEFSPEAKYQEQDYVWTIDPIDGTRNLVQGVPIFGMLVSLFKGEEILGGIIHLPILGETVYATKGEGAFYRRLGSNTAEFTRCKVSEVEKIEEAICCHSGAEIFKKHQCYPLFFKLQDSFRLCRTFCDCYGYVLLATGRTDVMLDPYLEIWDVLPLKIIVEEAGGILTGIDGDNSIRLRSAVGSNKKIYSDVMKLINGAE